MSCYWRGRTHERRMYVTSIDERLFDERMSRGRVLRLGAVGAVGVIAAGCGGSSKKASGAGSAIGKSDKAVTLNWLTWSDHYANDQLAAVKQQTNEQGRPQLFSDNADAYLKIKQTGSQFDIVSGDALWVPKYNKDGLTESFDLSSLPVSSQLYSIARNFPFWKDGSNYMGIRSRGRPCRSTTTQSTCTRSRTRGTRSSIRSTRARCPSRTSPLT